MDWYLKELFQDRRFRLAGAVAIGSIVLMIVSMLIGRVWAVRIAEFVFLPLLILSVGGMFFLFWKLVQSDYQDRRRRGAGR